MSANPVTDWIQTHGSPVTTTDPTKPTTDLEPLVAIARDAHVVGLGESTHGAHEQFTIKHRAVRVLVEQLGFRCIALEEDWTKGLELDQYLLTGEGDLRNILADAGPPWRTEEIFDLLSWTRSYNQGHPRDMVRLVGVDVVAARGSAYEAVLSYVAQAAPEHTAALEELFATIRPHGSVHEHIAWMHREADKPALLDCARRAHDLVKSLPATDDRALALRHAKAILDFYTYHSQREVTFRDQQMADNLIWWCTRTGAKTIYWAANAHTANGPQLEISYPPFPDSKGRSAGAYLREYFGPSYLSLGVTFDHGAVNVGWAPPHPVDVPPPPVHFAESALNQNERAGIVIDLHSPAPQQVQDWLGESTTVRMIGPSYEPDRDALYHMSNGSLAEWFDVIIHVPQVTPTRLLQSTTE